MFSIFQMWPYIWRLRGSKALLLLDSTVPWSWDRALLAHEAALMTVNLTIRWCHADSTPAIGQTVQYRLVCHRLLVKSIPFLLVVSRVMHCNHFHLLAPPFGHHSWTILCLTLIWPQRQIGHLFSIFPSARGLDFAIPSELWASSQPFKTLLSSHMPTVRLIYPRTSLSIGFLYPSP